MTPSANLPRLLEAFFTDRLVRQRQASPHTIAAYRDTFRLLLGFARERLAKEPSSFGLADLDAPLIGAFLDHLEKARDNKARTRNVRLAAIHSFFRYAALHEPGHAGSIQRVLAMPSKRYDRKLVGFLSRPEMDAILAAPDRTSWAGRRDFILLLVAIQTGLRVSEMIGLRPCDIALDAGAHVRCVGKGRKERCTPLRKEAVAALRGWMRECPRDPTGPLFPNARGGRLSRDGVQYVLAKHVRCRPEELPFIEAEAHLAPRAPALHGDGSASTRRRPIRHRPLARPRVDRDHAGLPHRRPQDEREGPRSLGADEGLWRSLPTGRSTSRLPQGPLIMPSLPARLAQDAPGDPHLAGAARHNPELGIMALMPSSA